MGFCLIPDYSFSEISKISPSFLEDNNIKFLMIDLDNTLAAYDEHAPSDDILTWMQSIKSSSINMAIVSNSTNMKRVSAFAEAFDVHAVHRARKPSPKSLRKCIEAEHISSNESALIGDQIFTDVLAANIADVTSIIVKPRKFTNTLLALRYIFELPIRFFSRNKLC